MVYGGVESVRHEGGGMLNDGQRLGRRQEAGRPREKNGNVEQDAEERVPVVADLKRLDGEGPSALLTGADRCALDTPPREDVHPEQRDENNGY